MGLTIPSYLKQFLGLAMSTRMLKADGAGGDNAADGTGGGVVVTDRDGNVVHRAGNGDPADGAGERDTVDAGPAEAVSLVGLVTANPPLNAFDVARNGDIAAVYGTGGGDAARVTGNSHAADAGGNVADGPSNSGAGDCNMVRRAFGGDVAGGLGDGEVADGAGNALDVAGKNGDAAAGAGECNTLDGTCGGDVAGGAGENDATGAAGHIAEGSAPGAADGDTSHGASNGVVADGACAGTFTDEAGAAGNEAGNAKLANEGTGVRDLADAAHVGVGVADDVAGDDVAVDAAKGNDIAEKAMILTRLLGRLILTIHHQKDHRQRHFLSRFHRRFVPG
eukprot:1930021-Pleurochrysis_carterae.AAC.1